MGKPGVISATTFRAEGLVRRILTPAWLGEPGAGRPKDTGREVNALWDTGATHSVVTQTVAMELGLVEIDRTTIGGVHARKPAAVYLADLELTNGVILNSIPIVSPLEAEDPHDFDFIIGMDVIIAGDFAITNSKGKTVVSVRFPSTTEIDFVKEVERMNKRAQRNKKPQSGRTMRVKILNPETGKTMTVKEQQVSNYLAKGWKVVDGS